MHLYLGCRSLQSRDLYYINPRMAILKQILHAGLFHITFPSHPYHFSISSVLLFHHPYHFSISLSISFIDSISFHSNAPRRSNIHYFGRTNKNRREKEQISQTLLQEVVRRLYTTTYLQLRPGSSSRSIDQCWR